MDNDPIKPDEVKMEHGEYGLPEPTPGVWDTRGKAITGFFVILTVGLPILIIVGLFMWGLVEIMWRWVFG